jgi:hypothetical protein
MVLVEDVPEPGPLQGVLKMLSLMPIGLGDVIRANMEDMGLGKKD